MQGVRRAQPTLGETFVVVGLGILPDPDAAAGLAALGAGLALALAGAAAADRQRRPGLRRRTDPASARIVRARPWDAAMIALAPTIILAGLINWDLIPVGLTMGAILLWARRMPTWARGR